MIDGPSVTPAHNETLTKESLRLVVATLCVQDALSGSLTASVARGANHDVSSRTDNYASTWLRAWSHLGNQTTTCLGRAPGSATAFSRTARRTPRCRTVTDDQPCSFGPFRSSQQGAVRRLRVGFALSQWPSSLRRQTSCLASNTVAPRRRKFAAASA